MRSFGARYAAVVAPIPLTGVGTAIGPTIASSIDTEFALIDANVGGLFDAIKTGSVPAKDAHRYVAELLQTIDQGRLRLLDAIAGAGSGERVRLEGALKLFGRAFITLHDPADPATDAERAVEGARGRGVSRPLLDPDGRRRRQALLSDRRSARYPLASFAALLDKLESPALIIGTNSLTVKGASLGGREVDIAIPLSGGGLLIDWPRRASGFPRRLAWREFARQAILERELATALADLAQAGLLGPEAGPLPGLNEYAASIRESSIHRGLLDPAWVEARERYFSIAAGAIGAMAEAKALGKPHDLDAASIHAAFAGARETYEELSRLRRSLRRALEGSFCIISPSDGGRGQLTTPFGDDASEGLAQAAIAGSILSQRFMRELPAWLGLGLGSLLVLATSAAYVLLGSRWALAEGAMLALLGAIGCSALFLATGQFLSPLPLIAGPAVSGIAVLQFHGKPTTGGNSRFDVPRR